MRKPPEILIFRLQRFNNNASKLDHVVGLVQHLDTQNEVVYLWARTLINQVKVEPYQPG